MDERGFVRICLGVLLFQAVLGWMLQIYHPWIAEWVFDRKQKHTFPTSPDSLSGSSSSSNMHSAVTTAGLHNSPSLRSSLWWPDPPTDLLGFTEYLQSPNTTASGPLDPKLGNIACMTVAFLVQSLASLSGVGGGAFFVPLVMMCLRFGLKRAIVLSQATTAATSLTSVLINIPRRHPDTPATKTLINYEMCLSFIPALLLGISIGVVLNTVFPVWLITTTLVTLLGFLTVRTVHRGVLEWHHEEVVHLHEEQCAQRAAASAAAAAENGTLKGVLKKSSSENSSSAVILIEDPGSTDSKQSNKIAAADQDNTNADLQAAAAVGSSLRVKRVKYPYLEFLGVVLQWLTFGALLVVREEAERCTVWYFVAFGGQVLFAVICTLVFSYVCIAKPARKTAAAAAAAAQTAATQTSQPDDLTAPLLAESTAGSSSSSSSNDQDFAPHLNHSISGELRQWNADHDRVLQKQQSMLHLMIMAVEIIGAGVVAGLNGVGGGMMMAPLLLDAGVQPQSAAASSNVLTFMCASGATLAYALDNKLPLQYVAVYGPLCATASLIGLTVVFRVVRRSGHPSLVVYFMALLMGVGATASGVYGYMDAYKRYVKGEERFTGVC